MIMQLIYTKQKGVLILNKNEFKALIIDALMDYLNKRAPYFEDYFEILMDGYDVDRVEINIDGEKYFVKNEKEFVKLVKKIFPDFEKKLLDFLKKEL
jgi:hypothetical protein